MKKMTSAEMRSVNGGSLIAAAVVGWCVGKLLVCHTLKPGKC